VEKINGGSSENESVVEDTLDVEERPADVNSTHGKRVQGATE
jgi:hypothetical protein